MSAASANNLIVLAAGGTGGHLFPAQALAGRLGARGWRIVVMTDARFVHYATQFPGARIEMEMPGRGAEFAVRFPELPNRPFAASELSDGTLHFLALMGALLAYRLPPFIALNEPETSLHPDLLPALARAIAKAAMRSQVWVVTHSRELTDALAQETGILARQVVRKEGGTWLEGLSALGIFSED